MDIKRKVYREREELPAFVCPLHKLVYMKSSTDPETAENVWPAQFGKVLTVDEDAGDYWKVHVATGKYTWVEAKEKVIIKGETVFKSKKVKKRETVEGYIRKELVIDERIEDHAKLPYKNEMDRPILCSKTLHGRPVVQIRPGETVNAFASVAGCVLTNKGWAECTLITKREEPPKKRAWLRKVPISDNSGILILLETLADNAFDDYVNCPFERPKIRAWTKTESFKVYFGDEFGKQFLDRANARIRPPVSAVAAGFRSKAEIMAELTGKNDRE